MKLFADEHGARVAVASCQPSAAPRKGLASILAREPLLLFLLIGSLLFAADRLLGSGAGIEDNPKVIRVDREELLRFLQFRSKVFSEDGAGRSLDAMSREEKARLMKSYVREEALYREALAWGLDKQDYVIRRRLVQSLEFALAADPVTAHVPQEAELRRFYAANPQLYALSPTISFSHVFFQAAPAAADRARSALAELRGGRADPGTVGDRFLYNLTYARQPKDSIERDFGKDFARTVFAIDRTGAWIGPIASGHGLHLVYLAGKDQGGLPPYDSVRAKVTADAVQAIERERQEAALKEVVSGYALDISREL